MVTAFTNLKNNCATVLNASIDSAVTTIQAVAGGGAQFPPTPFYLSCEYEVMKCTGRSTDTLTVVRGQDGTTAASHPAGAVIEQRNNAAMWTDISSAVVNIENGTTPIPLNVPDGSIADVKLASDVARPNLFQNGGFESWNSPGPFTSNGQNLSAAWQITTPGGGILLSITRDSANKDVDSQYCAAVVASGSGYVPGTTFAGVRYNPLALGGPAVVQLRGNVLTASFRIKTATANAVRIRAVDDGSGGNVYSSYHPGNGTYQTLSLSYTLSNTANQLHFQVLFDAPCTGYIDNATLVLGSIASNYIPALSVPDSIPNAYLASDVARANLLTNGGFEIWQRGNGPFTGSSNFTADRWQVWPGGGTISLSRDTANQISGVSCAAFVVGGPVSSGNFAQLLQWAKDLGPLVRDSTLTFSVKVKAPAPNAVRPNLNDGATDTLGAYNISSGVWETLTVSAFMAAGSDCMVRLRFEAVGTYYIDAAVLAVSSVPVDYAPLHPADDLARCLRYYHRRHATVTMNPATGMQINGTAANIVLIFQTLMGGVPTITVSAPGDWQFVVGGGGGITAVALNAVYSSAMSAMLGGSASGFTSGHATYLQNTNGNAMINSEWNP